MFFFKSRKFDPLTFEKTLQGISTKITHNERTTKQLQASKGYYAFHLPLYLIGIYLVYFSYIYATIDLGIDEGLIHALLKPRIFGSLVGLFLLLIVVYIAVIKGYTFLLERKIKAGEHLKQQHSDLLMQLKEKTNFDKTKDLLVRFGDGEDIAGMEKEIEEIRQKKEKYKAMLAASDSKKDAKALIMEDLKRNEGKGTGYYQMLINSILGDDELSPDQRYALICDQCGQHNGLAPPGELPFKVKYICPRCGKVHGEEEQEKEDKGAKAAVVGEKAVSDTPQQQRSEL